MPFVVAFERHHKFVRFNAAGRTSFKRFAGLIMGMAAEIDQHEDNRILVDLRSVEGRLSTTEQQLVGELAAAKLPMVFKIASIVPEGEVARNSERAAIKAGLALRVFESEAAALSWLLEGVHA